MSASVMFLLDVNVPMYAAGREHPYKEACQSVLRAVTRTQITVAIDTEIVQEILHRYGALGRYTEASTLASDLLTLVPTVYPVTLRDVKLAIELFRQYAPQGVRSRDVIHVAVMLNNGIREIISTDKHFDIIAGIHRVDPTDLAQRL
ncbi:Ribonuclease VapC13 [bacterium HR16]|nr:Ribonuclease VapC13 [bacterium HR16]